MSSINDIMATVNKTSLFGHLSPDCIQTARSERQEAERRMKEHKRQREAEQMQYREEEEERKRQDEEFEAREYEEYLAKYKKRGILQQDNRILQNEPHVRNYVKDSGDGGFFSNRAQVEIWQPGPAPRYTQFDQYACPTFTFRPVDEDSSVERSPTLSANNFPALPEPAPVAPKCLAAAKPRRNRVAANFTNRPPEPQPTVEPAAAPRRPSWRDPPITVSINDLRPDRRVIGLINAHLSSARDEFTMRDDDFPPIGLRPGKN